MGWVLSKVLPFWTPADYDDPDPATGLSPRQKDIVQGTWKIVRADVRSNGINLFLKFFDTYPEYLLMFKAFASVPRDQLPKNGRLLAHATSVMYALNSVIDNLQNPDCLVELLHKVGTSHRPRNLQASHFQNLGKVLVEYLEEALGKNVMNEKAKEAWIKTLEVANSLIIKSLEGEDD